MDIHVADTLSRKSLPDHNDTLREGMDMQVHTVYSSLPVSDNKIRTETEKETQLIALRKTIKDGWPGERRMCPQGIAEY